MAKRLWWIALLVVPLVLSAALGGGNLIKRVSMVAAAGEDRAVVHTVYVTGKIDPPRLYRRVWHLIKEEYYDQTYNGQSWARWKHHYDGKLKTLEDAHKAIETMLASLGDRYTRFLDRDAFADEKSQIDARLFGIGVQIGMDKTHKIIVIAPIEGTPAARAGLMPGDEIFEVDSKSTKGMSVEEAAQHIKGPLNTRVTLTLMRGDKKLFVPIVRAEIPIKSVQMAKMLDEEIGYIRLSSFISQQAAIEMGEAVDQLSRAKALIIDLRDNPGGLLTNAVDISNFFLKGGNIVSTVDRDGYKTPALSAGKPVSDQELVILINQGSASASEITSGALRDNGRATLVGHRTFGKGLVQGINRLEDGSGVNITIARYLTPREVDINQKGIEPDVAVKLSEKDYESGRGPWWMDPEGPLAKRAPEDMKDIQLAKAYEIARVKIGSQAGSLASGLR